MLHVSLKHFKVENHGFFRLVSQVRSVVSVGRGVVSVVRGVVSVVGLVGGSSPLGRIRSLTRFTLTCYIILSIQLEFPILCI